MAASSEPLHQVRYAAQMGPWPCDPSGNSTVPVRDRIQVNRVIRSLDTILHTDTHMTHLVQALRERCEPSELHKLLQACCASIPWAKNDVLAPEAAVQQCPVPVLCEYGQPYNTNCKPPPYPHSPVHRPPLQAYQSKGAPPGQPDAQATSGKGPDPQAPASASSEVWWTPPPTWPPVKSMSAALTPEVHADTTQGQPQTHNSDNPDRTQPTSRVESKPETPQAPLAEAGPCRPPRQPLRPLPRSRSRQTRSSHPYTRPRGPGRRPPPPQQRRSGRTTQDRETSRGTSCFQTYHRVEYKRWEDVLPLTDEDAEEKWRGEKVCKNPLLRGCVACQIPCPNCTGRLCKRTCAPFVTAHRGHHCNECYKRLGRHGQADVLP